MPSTAPLKPSTATRVARIPYLNSVAFFRGLAWEERYELVDCTPSELGRLAAAGGIEAGLLSAADFFRLGKRYERLGHFGIAVRGRAQSVLLFSKRPLRQLDGAVIAVTEQTSTSVLLLRLILERKHRLAPADYQPRSHAEADALLLIGNEALQFKQANRQYPYETDLGFEWWLWQHQPFVFALWAARKNLGDKDKRQIEAGLARSLALNSAAFEAIASQWQETLATPASQLKQYLESFVYRLGPAEEEGLKTFKALLDEHRLL